MCKVQIKGFREIFTVSSTPLRYVIEGLCKFLSLAGKVEDSVCEKMVELEWKPIYNSAMAAYLDPVDICGNVMSFCPATKVYLDFNEYKN